MLRWLFWGTTEGNKAGYIVFRHEEVENRLQGEAATRIKAAKENGVA
jgi:hypothetical protein